MNYLIMLSQKSFLTLGHIMSEISIIPETKWPDKFKNFKSVFDNFNRQRDKSKKNVGAIISDFEVRGFLSTLAGYYELLEANISACDSIPTRYWLNRSRKKIERLTAEISAQLNDQGFTVK